MELNFSEDFDYNSALSDSMECDFLGEQEMVPRIGEDYQVEIPHLLEKKDYFNQEQSPEAVNSHGLDCFLGLSIPVMFINQEVKELEHEGTEYLVPGSAGDSWNEGDKASFLLGLYIFSRNFAQLKQFLERKKMEDILSFYYGEFYQSCDYRRWSESRKKRNRGVVGKKIFTGRRKQQLLSRILPSLSEERKNNTLQVFKTFEEGKISFEDFIFLIKEIIGIRTFVEAIGIGKGKKDITTMTQEPSRTNQVNPVVVRTRKPLSSLTMDEIVKYLNGGCRLSKARSHDLFWEAVWPRLLARGWNSEGQKGQVYNAGGIKNNLVFLVPGVVKFSRRKLKKGVDYFDSVPDVLNKVALDPSLLELDNDEEEEEENETKNNETNSEDGEDVSPERRYCYLQPRAINSTTEGMKFTVVDSCSGDSKPYKYRKLHGLSFDDYRKVNSGRYGETSEDTPLFDDDHPVQVPSPCPDSESVLLATNGKGKEEQTRKMADFEDNPHGVSPVIKRRRLTACNNAKPGKDATDDHVKSVQENPSPTLVISLPAARASTVHDDNIRIPNDIPDPQEDAGPVRNNFDLNFPPEPGNESPVAESSRTEHEGDKMSKSSQLNDVTNTQRRGTRNRPPTARALEAVACGFLSTNTREKKGRKTSTCCSSIHSKRAQGEIETEEVSDVQINPVEPSTVITQERSQSEASSASGESNRTKRSPVYKRT